MLTIIPLNTFFYLPFEVILVFLGRKNFIVFSKCALPDLSITAPSIILSVLSYNHPLIVVLFHSFVIVLFFLPFICLSHHHSNSLFGSCYSFTIIVTPRLVPHRKWTRLRLTYENLMSVLLSISY